MKTVAILVGVGLLGFLALLDPVKANDLLGVVMRGSDGQVSSHSQPVSVAECDALIDALNEYRANGASMLLTLSAPEFTGVVLEASCIHEDGTMTEPGPMLDLGL